jgi:hypothetical protein
MTTVKVDVATAVERMRSAGHHVMVARELSGGYSYQSFLDEEELHVWMSGIPDKDRHIYAVDLLAAPAAARHRGRSL